MRQLSEEKGITPLVSVRLPQPVIDQIDALLDGLGPYPMGRPGMAATLRMLISEGIERMAAKHRVKLPGQAAPPKAARASKPKAPKKKAGKVIGNAWHVKRAEARAAERAAAGCTCINRHVSSCKLFKRAATVPPPAAAAETT